MLCKAQLCINTYIYMPIIPLLRCPGVYKVRLVQLELLPAHLVFAFTVSLGLIRRDKSTRHSVSTVLEVNEKRIPSPGRVVVD